MFNVKRKSVVTGVFAISQILILSGCSGSFTADKAATGAANQNQNLLSSSISLSIPQANNYTDASGSSSTIQMVAGSNYTFQLGAANAPAGSNVLLTITNVDSPSGAVTTQTLPLGSSSFTAPSTGDYAFKIQIKNGGSVLATKSYQAAVACPNPTFTHANAAGISASPSAGASNNMFDVSVAGVLSGANGTAPYTCALDVTGVGIRDTAFGPCTTFAKQYINYLGNRNIGVIVKDACNTAVSVSASPAVNLAKSIPAMPGNTFSQGTVSSAQGAAASDARVHNVFYLATNQLSPYDGVVQPNFADDGSSFTIDSSINYGQASSVPNGLKIQVKNLGGNYNVSSNLNGSILTNNATLSVTYSVDQAGDQEAATSWTSTSCTQSVSAAVRNVTPGSCVDPSKPLGDSNAVDVEVWGTYTCQMAGAEGNMTLTGSFDGIKHMGDSCYGGGGGGGGPVVSF